MYIYIYGSNNYYDTLADNISIDRLTTKIAMLFGTFWKIYLAKII